MSLNLSIVIPAYNESKIIVRSVLKIKNYLDRKTKNYEIIIVDDGSTDSTTGELAALSDDYRLNIISYGVNRGKGYAVKKGVLASTKDCILFSDADLSTPIEQLDNLLPFLSGHDIVIGSRALKESLVVLKQPFCRRITGKLIHLIIRFLIINDFKDTQCGFKLFKRETAQKIFKKTNINGFLFDVELLCLAKIMGFKIKEAPVTWYNSLDSKVSISRHSPEILKDLLKIFWRYKLKECFHSRKKTI